MSNYYVKPIGKITMNEQGTFIAVASEYRPGLQALTGFSHLNIIWWFSDFDEEETRKILETTQPYKKAPEVVGIFATRSPIRPNPLALSTVQVLIEWRIQKCPLGANIGPRALKNRRLLIGKTNLISKSKDLLQVKTSAIGLG